MPTFLEMPRDDQESILRIAENATGREAFILEKDVWVVWTLNVLFTSQFGPHLVFKGGTSLSKVHKAIDRFSEDVDVTYDIRQIVDPAKTAAEALPATGSQARKWTDQVADKLPKWVETEIAPIIQAAISSQNLHAWLEIKGDKLEVHYKPTVEGYGYVRPRILLEFGGRSTGEPCDEHDVACDSAPHVSAVDFPTARPRTMRAERTFWEKATAIHGYASGGRLPGEAIARHWLDIHNMMAAGIGVKAAEDRELARQVADHKTLFFKVSTPDGPINYHQAVSGDLKLAPTDEKALADLAEDYAAMLDARLPHGGSAPSFDELMQSCAQIADTINATTRKLWADRAS